MPTIDLTNIREQATVVAQRIMSSENLDLMIVGTLLAIVIVLSLATIWRNRVRNAAPATRPSSASGFTRWLTPLGARSIPADAGTPLPEPRRKSGSQKVIRVSTPVSRVPTRALKAAGANALDIARKTGLARDAVTMMIANAAPKNAPATPQAKPAIAAKATVAQAPARAADAGRAMSAPGAYTAAQRAIAPKVDRGGVGTRFTARLS